MKQFVYNDKKLTKFIKASGCAAKLDPSGLTQSIAEILEPNAKILSSLNSNEDAGVLMLSKDLALVQTLDFITPVVDDPFLFGQIAAANSLSDVFAMGANALSAMNIVGFDKCNFSQEILHEIMAGGKSKIKECGAILVGGHSIETKENIYGLSVTGSVHPDKFWSNNTAKVGDLLILTKPLGSGVMSTAIKGDMASLSQIKEAVSIMSQLNFYAIKACDGLEINAATDVTGFGFLGHLSEMLNERVSFEIYENVVPILKSAKDLASQGIIPEGSYKNAEFTKNLCNKEANILLSDAQTSGGLILSVPDKDAYKALANLKNAGYERAEIIGTVKSKGEFGINLV
ncbi:selenophosphate synthetase [Campylobacter iguaniorum]|uniref:selenide, water dikinase SelD n=1 Tax=Campylobacter iguaniorum TaxID=1244531 RepID=UPI0007C9B898|nr:selenide, water dikinase SelD [Campylobacter iguaniorum]ANE35387.1 selenophosphate synthetase [Campylobacter iguaniorum]